VTLARLASLRRDVDELKRGLGRMTVSASAVQFVGAADLVLGTRADFGRACSRNGTVLETIRQAPEELYEAFLARAEIAANRRNAWRLVIGGIDPDFNPDFDPGSSQPSVPPPKGAIVLPDGEGLHLGERRALKLILASKRTVLRAGRRWGKSSVLVAIAIDEALRGRPVGVFSPFYKTAVPVFDALAYALAPLIVSRHRGQGELVLATGSHIDVWTLEASTIVARGRKYACALVDEAAHVKADMAIIWKASISPTLIDIADSYAVAASTPWGTDPANFFFQICNDKSLGWVEMHARSEDNPYLPRESLEEEKRVNSPLVWRQEYEAEFTSLDSAALIDVTKLLQPDGSPWPEPERFDYLFVTVDSAIRTGAGADGTAAVYCAIVGRIPSDVKLYFLDYDVVQVTAGVLERWFDAVVARARELIGERTMLAGPFYVEDASSGPILVEKYPSIVEALPHQWTMEGKDLRAYAVQQYFNGGRVRITEACYAKTVSFKGVRVNHLWTQLNAFVLGDKEASKRADDLLDAAVYAASVSFRPRPVNK
jgi:hypothetical protein